jgi:hypothetical protein
LSFFDEADEPRPASRPGPRRRRPSGRGRPPTQQQAIQTRRIVAAVVVVVVIVLLALLVHSCDVSAQNSSLRDYTNGVSLQIQKSDATSAQMYRALDSTANHSNPTGLAQQITGYADAAQQELTAVENLSVPGSMQPAQDKLVWVMRMRRDGVRTIASEIQPALGTSTNLDAIRQIATANSLFYGSDVLYKAYVAPEMAAALHAAGIGVGGTNGESINPGQFLPNLGWLDSTFIAAKLGSHVPSSHQNSAAPGLHGHVLNSVSVAGTQLSTATTNTIPASPPPTFVLNLTNAGQYTEYNVGCRVTVIGLSDTGSTTLSQTTAGQTTDCSVKLPRAPTPGTYQVTAEVLPVPGEKNTANNSITYSVTFQ